MNIDLTILITGATGQLGIDLVEELAHDYKVIPASSDHFDITNFEQTINFVQESKPDVIIHTAAWTDVDSCESQQDKAFAINGLGTRNVAIAAREMDAKLFYISTDYVFDGEKEEPYLEFDQPNPISVYGKSKLWGEQFVKEQLNKFFIIRTAWLYGTNGTNFVKTMLRLAKEKQQLKVVNDQFGSPTWTIDIAQQLKELIPTEFYGIYHCTSQGSCSWYEFAQEIFKYAGYKAENDSNGCTQLIPNTQDSKPKPLQLRSKTLKSVSSSEFKRPAPRPKNSVLENYMLKLQNVDIMPHWTDSLKKFMKTRRQSIADSQ